MSYCTCTALNVSILLACSQKWYFCKGIILCSPCEWQACRLRLKKKTLAFGSVLKVFVKLKSRLKVKHIHTWEENIIYYDYDFSKRIPQVWTKHLCFVLVLFHVTHMNSPVGKHTLSPILLFRNNNVFSQSASCYPKSAVLLLVY